MTFSSLEAALTGGFIAFAVAIGSSILTFVLVNTRKAQKEDVAKLETRVKTLEDTAVTQGHCKERSTESEKQQAREYTQLTTDIVELRSQLKDTFEKVLFQVGEVHNRMTELCQRVARIEERTKDGSGGK